MNYSLFGVLASIVFLGTACSKQRSKMNTIDWSSDSHHSLSALVENSQGKTVAAISSKYGQIEIQNQTVDGFEIDGAFVKKIKNNQGQATRINALLESREISSFNKARWNLARKNKERYLETILSKENHLENKKIESFDLKLASEDEDLLPRWFLKYFETNGELWQIIFSYNLNILSQSRMGSEFEVTSAWVYPKGPKYGNLQQVYLMNLSKGDELMSNRIKVSSADQTKIQVSGQPLQFTISDKRFDQVQSFYLSQKALAWFAKEFGVQYNSILDLEIHVGAPEKTNTAFYYSGRVRLGAGDDIVYKKIPWDPSIVTHESSHFVIDMISHLPFQGEGGSLNEAFADYFTAVILDNPILGEGAYLQGPYKRRIDIFKKYSEKTGGLYADSLIVSSLLWDLNQKLGEKKGLLIAFKTLHNLNPQSTLDSFKSELVAQSVSNLNLIDQAKVTTSLNQREWNMM